MNGLTAAEIEVEQLNNVILAAENWSKEYKKDPDTHASIIKAESRLETVLRRYFRELAERVPEYISWAAYYERQRQIAAAADDFKVDVLILDDLLGQEDAIFIQTVFDPIAQAIAVGANAGEKVYSVDLGLSRTSAVIQQKAQEMTAELVGKKIDKSGNMIDNPSAKFRVNEKTRADIRQSITTSLSLGEDQKAATERLLNTVKNPKRAGTIARTEAVNGYQKGLLAMGNESGAVGKEWQSVNPDDVCGTYARAGIVAIDHVYDKLRGIKAPAAHPNCRCGLVLIYPEDPRAAQLNQVDPLPDPDLENMDLSSIVRKGNTRPSSEINKKIEDLLNHGDDKTKVIEAIKQAQMLPKDDIAAMLSSITYKGKAITQDYYTVRFNPTTKKIERILKDPALDPLKMSADELFKRAK